MVMSDLLFTGISCVEKPTEVNTSTSEPAALIEKLPASLVTVARAVPITVTVTPATGLLVASVTFPETVCAIAAVENNKVKTKEQSNLPSAGGDASLNFLLIIASFLLYNKVSHQEQSISKHT